MFLFCLVSFFKFVALQAINMVLFEQLGLVLIHNVITGGCVQGLGLPISTPNTIRGLVSSYLSEIKVPETRNRRSAEDDLYIKGGYQLTI